MRGAIAAWLVCTALALGCATPPEVATLSTESVSATSRDAIEIRLEFGAQADLDLYVTDPRQETVYFANSPAVSGGALDGDRRCDAEAPRAETVTYPSAASGRYRIAVDYPEPCGESREPVEFRIVVTADGWHHETRGQILPGHFLLKVVEVDLTAQNPSPP